MQLDHISDQHFESLLKNDEKGVLKIYEELFPKIKKFVLSHGGEEQDAKDVMQKALLQVAVRARVNGFKINTSFEGYFFITSRNVWFRELKKQKTEVTNYNFSDHISKEQDIADSAVEQEKWELFEEKMKLLSDNCRKLLGMFFKKINYKEIVKELGYATENVVKQRIFKCKARLKEIIQSDSRFKDLRG